MRLATIGWTRKIRNAEANVVATNNSTPGGIASRAASRSASATAGAGSLAAAGSGEGSMRPLLQHAEQIAVVVGPERRARDHLGRGPGDGWTAHAHAARAGALRRGARERAEAR